MGVVAVGTRPTHSDEGYEIPGAGLLVAAHGVREVPHCIGMQVRYAEFLLEHASVGTLCVFGACGRPPFGLQAGVSDAGADRGGEPFSDMDVQCRGHAFAEFAVGVVFAEIDIYTAGDADEDVVEKAVRFIGAAYDAVLRIAIAVLLCRGGKADDDKEGNKVEAFHV